MNRIKIPAADEQKYNYIIDTDNANVDKLSLSYPTELLHAYDKYGSGMICFSKWLKTVSKYTTFYYNSTSYYAVDTYYTRKDNIIAVVTHRTIKN